MWAKVWEVDSSSQSCIWEQLCPGPSLELNRPQQCLQA